jgi:hypothetical protein
MKAIIMFKTRFLKGELCSSHDPTQQLQLFPLWTTVKTETENENGKLRNPIVGKSVVRRKWVRWIIGESLEKVERRNLFRGAGTPTQIAVVAAANPATCGLHVYLVLSTLLFQR